MALDDLGNERIDFAWGNMPLQPNHDYDEDLDLRLNIALYPGDGMAEYILLHQDNGVTPSNMLDGVGNHVIALRQWSNFPDVAQDGVTGPTLTVDWWLPEVPATEFPDIVGATVEDAIKQLREVGVAENFLTDALTDNSENPYIGGETILPTSGVIIWHYMDPEEQIGTHWDGTPWLAKEANGLVEYAYSYPAEQTAITSYYQDGPDYFSSSNPADDIYWPWWLSFSVIQTTDPNKNSWSWWN
jgi:hypothetical protein